MEGLVDMMAGFYALEEKAKPHDRSLCFPSSERAPLNNSDCMTCYIHRCKGFGCYLLFRLCNIVYKFQNFGDPCVIVNQYKLLSLVLFAYCACKE